VNDDTVTFAKYEAVIENILFEISLLYTGYDWGIDITCPNVMLIIISEQVKNVRPIRFLIIVSSS